MNLVGLQFEVKVCENPACGHVSPYLLCIGFPLGAHWVDITQDGEWFHGRVDRGAVERFWMTEAEIKPFLAAALQEVDDVR